MKTSMFICILIGALCLTCTVADRSSSKKKLEDTINELVFAQEGEDDGDDGTLAQVISKMIQTELAQLQDDDENDGLADLEDDEDEGSDEKLVQEQDDGDDDADTEGLIKRRRPRRRRLYFPLLFTLRRLGRRLLSLGRQVSSIGRRLLLYSRRPFIWRRRG